MLKSTTFPESTYIWKIKRSNPTERVRKVTNFWIRTNCKTRGCHRGRSWECLGMLRVEQTTPSPTQDSVCVFANLFGELSLHCEGFDDPLPRIFLCALLQNGVTISKLHLSLIRQLLCYLHYRRNDHGSESWAKIFQI